MPRKRPEGALNKVKPALIEAALRAALEFVVVAVEPAMLLACWLVLLPAGAMDNTTAGTPGAGHHRSLQLTPPDGVARGQRILRRLSLYTIFRNIASGGFNGNSGPPNEGRHKAWFYHSNAPSGRSHCNEVSSIGVFAWQLSQPVG